VALADRTPTPEDLAWRRELDCALSVAAGRLPKRLQDVYTLCCTSGLSVREAAHTLGLTVSATKTRLFRAQHRMQSELSKVLVMRPQRKTSGARPPTIARSRIAA
jgi:DNA-directed RNA polymerase specialized sigma24 family protein